MHAPLQMHIPDTLLSLAVSVFCWVVTASILAVVLARANRTFSERQIPMMGVMAAFIFAAQMINFPVALGTSGHLLGAALASFVLGPPAAMLVMTAVIAVQALLFQDGGLLAMGANILNMGLVPAIVAYALYRPFIGRSRRVRLVTAGVAAWLTVISGALLTSLELWLSGSAKLGLVLPAMLGVHTLIGLGEALVTVATLSFLFRVRMDLMASPDATSRRTGWIVVGLLIALVVAVLSPLASANPDGLERVATDLGFLPEGRTAPYQVLPDYTIPFVGTTSISTILAGMFGVLVVAGLFLLIWNLFHKPAGKKSIHDSVFDRYRTGESVLHRLDPRVKVVVALIFILSNVLLPDTAWGGFILSYLLILIASWLSGLGPGFTSRRSFIALPFALAAVSVIFSIPGKELVTWRLGATSLTVTDAGVMRFISIMLRAWLSVQAAILLVATTRFPDLIHALEHLRVPRLLVTVIAFLYRYLFVLTDEVLRMTRARQARSASAADRRSGGSVFWRAHVAGNMVGQLFLRSYARSDRIYNAMLARGYAGQMRTLSLHQMSEREWWFITISLALLVLVQIVGRL